MKPFASDTSLRFVAIVVATLAAGFVATKVALRNASPPSAPKAGGLDNALEQTKRLISELKAADWKTWEVDPSLLRLPEQDNASREQDRAPDVTSFSVPRRVPTYDEVAVYSTTFVTWNSRPDAPGGPRDVRMGGFFIVGWMDGRVETIEASDVRYLANPQNEREMLYIFPGMDEYESAHRSLPGVPERTGT